MKTNKTHQGPKHKTKDTKNEINENNGKNGAYGFASLALVAALARPRGTLETGFNDLGGQKAPKTEPKRVQNRVQEAIQTQNTNSSKTMVFPMDFLDLRSPWLTFVSQKLVQDAIRIASSTRKRSESLLEASWSALGRSWGRKNKLGIALGRSWSALGPENNPT